MDPSRSHRLVHLINNCERPNIYIYIYLKTTCIVKFAKVYSRIHTDSRKL